MARFYYYDNHIHTDNSFNGKHNITLICEQAERLGVERIAITDYFSSDNFIKYEGKRRISQSIFDVMKMRSIYSNRLTISIGLEVGQVPINTPIAEKLIQVYPFDYIIGSARKAEGFRSFSHLNFEPEEEGGEPPSYDLPAMLENYCQQLYKTAQWGKVDAIASFGNPFFHLREKGIEIDEMAYFTWYNRIFKEMAMRDIALNLDGFMIGENSKTPILEYIKAFKAQGGQRVVVGSGATSYLQVGQGIMEIYTMLKEAGFTSAYYFKERKPIEIPL